ncbi:GAF domain-containing sensor histidine kinase [Archangium lansingense]|uniref:histidine kinase n=1 Tax=Archangium lansingense TaxID=2995310 RepID=A0ABT3ZZS4_9BACT|nr:GAF domain-containing sensor histidine kinase [Archangium lansinium]MCY1074554.1 GAF domain-containing sensor histidine kinase [Archangium lansinium]
MQTFLSMDLVTRAEEAGVSFQDALQLLDASRLLAREQDVRGIAQCVCGLVKRLVGADGVTFVLSEGELVYYAEEESPERLWKGRRFPAKHCISGWAIMNRQAAVIEDIYADPRIPIEAYRPTFVRSLAMVPIGQAQPLGSIGVYWARNHKATERELFLVEMLAEASLSALTRASLQQDVEHLRSRLAPVEGTSRGEEEPSLAQFLPVVAHDLKNPLGAISLASQSLIRRGGLGGDELLNVRRILSSVERARRLVEEVLEYARLKARGGLPLDLEDARLDDVARSVVEEARTAFPGRRIELIAEETNGTWDSLRLSEVMGNLLGNALQYGHPERPVTLRVEARDGETCVEVHNFGPVIPEELLPVLFEPFRRGRGDGRGSVGLGLFIVKQIIQAHGGHIGVRSTSEQGTSFSVHLPRCQVQPIDPPREGAVARRANPSRQPDGGWTSATVTDLEGGLAGPW